MSRTINRMCRNAMNWVVARRELRRFKRLLNYRATSLAVGLVLSGSLQPPRFSTRWHV